MPTSAEYMLSPLDALIAGAEADVDRGFQRFQSMLQNAGFESAFVGIAPITRSLSLERPVFRHIGRFFTPEYERDSLSDPNFFGGSRILRKVIVGQKEVCFDNDAYWKQLPPGERKIDMPIYTDYGIKGYYVSKPLKFRNSSIQSSIIVYDTTNQRSFRHLMKERRASLFLASIYYLTSLSCASGVFADAPRDSYALLSDRERECLLWAAIGYTSDQIADVLGISTPTVSIYFRRAQKKLGAANRTQACAFAIVDGLINP